MVREFIFYCFCKKMEARELAWRTHQTLLVSPLRGWWGMEEEDPCTSSLPFPVLSLGPRLNRGQAAVTFAL